MGIGKATQGAVAKIRADVDAAFLCIRQAL